MERTRAVVFVAIIGVLVFGLFGCSERSTDPWVSADLEEALALAGDRGTLVMVNFKTDWCSWCKRLDKDTFTDASVIEELGKMVALRLDAENEGVEAAERFGIRSYPTIVFVDPAGKEVDRILGYLPPDAFLAEVARIRAGDTFNACLARLNEDPSNVESLERAVEGLLERSDAAAAVRRIESFHASHGEEGMSHDQCQKLMFTARSIMSERLYKRAARLYRNDWPEVPEVPNSLGVANLYALVSNLDGFEDDRVELRSARSRDAQALLDSLDVEILDSEQLLDVGGFAFRAGRYERATEIYLLWFEKRKVGEGVDRLNQVAWNLYLMNREFEAAVAMAKEAYDVDRDPDVGDTLARLLYVSGRVDEAIEIETLAAESSDGRSAEEFFAVVESMLSGEDLGDHPGFEDFPGEKKS